MEIKALKFRANGFMKQPFALGGEDGQDKFDQKVMYRSSLQNHLIDTGKEVILVDTGLPESFPEEAPDENTFIYMGEKVDNFMEAFEKLPEDWKCPRCKQPKTKFNAA